MPVTADETGNALAVLGRGDVAVLAAGATAGKLDEIVVCTIPPHAGPKATGDYVAELDGKSTAELGRLVRLRFESPEALAVFARVVDGLYREMTKVKHGVC